MSTEEDFACDKFAPQKWRKDVCRNCYQSARLHEKKLSRQGTLTSPSTKIPPQSSPVVKASTLPPRIKPPTAPKSSLLLKTPPAPKPPIATTKVGVDSGLPAKPPPPPVAKPATGTGARPAPPKAEPKVFQQFQTKKEPVIDRSIPPKERTKQPELEGIQPGIVKEVHELAPTLKTNIPPEVQAILDQNAKSASDKAIDDKTAESVTQPPQESGPKEAAVTESGPSPPPPALPPRPAGYELADETSLTQTTSNDQKEAQPTTPATSSQPHTSQEEEQKVGGSASSVNEQSSSKADSKAITEVEATIQPPPANTEEGVVPTLDQEDGAKDEGKVEEKEGVSEEQLPEPALEVAAEPQPVIDVAPVCTDTVCFLPKRTQEQPGSNGGETDEKKEEAQVPKPDSEATVPTTKEGPASNTEESGASPISKDDKIGTVGKEKEQGPSEAELDKPAIPETQEEKQEEGDQTEPKENVELALPATETEPNETLQKEEMEQNGGDEQIMNVGGKEAVIDEIVTAQPVAILESQLESTDGGAAGASTEQTNEADQQTVAESQEESPASNEAIMDVTQSTLDEEKQQLEQAPVAVEPECGNGSIIDEKQATTTAVNDESLVVEEENSSKNAAAIDVATEAVTPEEEEVKSKIVPPPPPPAPPVPSGELHNEGIKRDAEGESASVGPSVPPAPADGIPLAPPPPPPPPPPPVGVNIPTGLPKAEEVKRKAQSVKPPQGAMAHEEAMAAIIGGVKLKSAPAPVERPPQETDAHEEVMAAIRGGVKLKSVPAPAERPVGLPDAYQVTMAAIRGGVQLKSVPAPAERRAGEEKIVDVASELRQKMLKQRRKEMEGITPQLELHREEANKLAELLLNCSGSHSFVHQLKSLLAQVDAFLAKCNIPTDVLAQKLQWPAHLVTDLREVIEHMRTLEQKVAAAETLCKQTLLKSAQPVPAPPPRPGQNGQTGSTGSLGRSSLSSTRGVNPAAVERCVQDVVRLAKDLSTDESRYFRAAQSYPIDVSDIQGMIHRAADTVAPLVEQMYEKAMQAHKSIFEVSVTKFDQGFRVQNARRLLKMCCEMSNVLGVHLQMPKHALYSDAQLKYRELAEDFHNAIKVMERRGDWDSEEQLQLGTQSKTGKKLELRSKEDSQLVQKIIEALSAAGGEGGLPEDLEEQLTPEVVARIEVQLIKAVMANGQLKVVDGVCALKSRVYSGDDESAALLHRYDFEWLLEAVVKGNHNLISHLVQSCGMFINTMSSAGVSVLHRAVQRQDIPTVAHLIRLGADPLLRNTFNSSSTQMLALKCFPPSHFSDKQEEKEPLFDLTAYINSPSLSDVVLVSEDGQNFHAHRIVLCAQSLVLKTMLDSEIWADSKNKEVLLPTISGRVTQLLLKYLYTGLCLFPRDDLNLGIELMAAADQFLLEPMKVQCERALSEKIDAEVVVPLYYAAFRFNTPKLLASCQNFLLSNYDKVEDPGHEALLHLLENSKATCS